MENSILDRASAMKSKRQKNFAFRSFQNHSNKKKNNFYHHRLMKYASREFIFFSRLSRKWNYSNDSFGKRFEEAEIRKIFAVQRDKT